MMWEINDDWSVYGCSVSYKVSFQTWSPPHVVVMDDASHTFPQITLIGAPKNTMVKKRSVKGNFVFDAQDNHLGNIKWNGT